MIDEPCRELRIGRQEHEDKEATSEGGHTVKNDRHFRDLFRQTIVPRILLPIPQPL